VVGGGSFGAGAAQGAIGGAGGGAISSFMTSQQMTNFKNGNGFVDNATAKRIADMKALGVSKEAMTSATRGTQAAESRTSSIYPEDILGKLSTYCDVAGLRALSVGFQVAEYTFTPSIGPYEIALRATGSGVGYGIGYFGGAALETRGLAVPGTRYWSAVGMSYVGEWAFGNVGKYLDGSE
jgi:hypothetical protein